MTQLRLTCQVNWGASLMKSWGCSKYRTLFLCCKLRNLVALWGQVFMNNAISESKTTISKKCSRQFKIIFWHGSWVLIPSRISSLQNDQFYEQLRRQIQIQLQKFNNLTDQRLVAPSQKEMIPSNINDSKLRNLYQQKTRAWICTGSH